MVSLNYKSLNREDNLEIASPTSFQFFFFFFFPFPEGIVNTYQEKFLSIYLAFGQIILKVLNILSYFSDSS